MLLVMAVVAPLATAGLGVGALTKIAPIEERTRATTMEVARANGLERAASRLDAPVIRAGNSVWVVIAAGIAAAVAGLGLGMVGGGRD
jgi:hypothetical protein